ncbi:uncharacterized protein LOC123298873 [Chrysoperla carnea]|uniref:uncharacterized protein LOC123298873 n=1 Tax=Chrysoperla carnea TaxID=189513 RepID=UPI001D0833BA|nr:uncharacterized protein LOC123298873 [Chrysoperla carnea]
MGPIVALLLSVVALSKANAPQNELFTIGKEVVFKYESHVTVQTNQPASYASLYGLQAEIYIQKTKEDTLMVRLDKIVFDLENGPVRVNVTTDVYVPIPTEAEALSLPFAIKYDSNNLVTAVIVESNDKEWSYNIKKSLASIFQFNSEVLSTFDRKQSHIEYSREQTIYGLCNVTYDVLPREDHVTVVKTVDPKQCGNDYNSKLNTDVFDVDSNRIYKINKNDNKGRVEMIEARGDIVFAEFKATAEMKSLKVHQRFMFVKEDAITNPLVISNQLVLSSLKYEDSLSKCHNVSIVDITGGRAKYNNDVPKILTLLEQLLDSLHENQLTLTKPDYKVLHLLQNLYEILENFDLHTLERTCSASQQKSQNVFDLFVQLLPNIQTHPSAMLLLNLIRKKKISDSMAVRALRDFPARVRCPNENLLKQLEDMLKLDKEGSRVHVASVLAYASLIKRTYLGVDENSIVLEKFIKLFMTKLINSRSYKIQVLYLHALGNLGMESVIYTLAPILTGEMEVRFNLRSLALWAVAPLLQKNSSLMIKYIWPILSDRKLDVSLRIVAYDIYIRTENPTLNRFMQLYWLMRDETNEHFYNFHYNTLVTITQLRYFLHGENQIVEIARAMLRMSRRPFIKYENVGIFVHDFIDKKSGLGAKVDNLYSFEHHVDIRTRIMSRASGYDTEIFSLHFAIPDDNESKLFNSKRYAADYHELIVRREGRVFMIYVGDSLNAFSDTTLDLGVNTGTNKHSKILEIPYLYERIMPTDFGVPVRMSELLAHILTIYFKGDNSEKKIDFEIKSLTFHNLRFNIYNPINDLWHGIEQNKHIFVQFGISISNGKNDSDVGKEVILKINKLSNGAVNGLQVHTENVAFIRGENAQELLIQSHKDSLVRRSVIRGEDYTTSTVVYNTESNTLGHHVEVKVFDCDRDVSRGGLITRLQGTKSNSYGYLTFEFLRLYLTTLFPNGYGSCGYGVRFTPLETFDHIKFEVRGNSINSKRYLGAFTFEIDVQSSTISVQNTSLAKYKSNLNVTVFELQRNGTIKWQIVHQDQVNKECKLDIDLRYSMKEDRFDSNLILSLGEVDKLGVITFELLGIRSEEQERILKERKITYNECRPEIIKGKYLAPVPVECAIAHSNLNRYAVNISANDVENRMELDVTIDTPRYQEVYTGIPQNRMSAWSLDDISLANIFFSGSKFDIQHVLSSALVHCVISKEHVLTLNGNIQKYELKNKWTSYLNTSINEVVLTVFVSKGSVKEPLQLAIKVRVGTDQIKIIPKGHEFVIKVNKKVVVPVVGKYTEELVWSYLMIESQKMIMFSIRMFGLHVIYDGKTIRAMISSDKGAVLVNNDKK